MIGRITGTLAEKAPPQVLGPISQIKIAAFLRLYRHIAGTIDPSHLERVPEESSNSVEIYYKLDDPGVSYLLDRCHHIFRGQEYSDIQEFISRHKDEGVLLLKGIYENPGQRKEGLHTQNGFRLSSLIRFILNVLISNPEFLHSRSS